MRLRPVRTATLCGVLFGIMGLVFAEVATAQTPPPTPQQRVANLKAWLQASQQQLRAYQWIETTTVSVDGEQKSQTRKRCYYGADGALEKVLVEETHSDEGGPPGILPPGRLLKKIAENKTKELAAYLQSAEQLIHQYIPPNPEKIQQVANSGNMAAQMLVPGRKAQLNFANYVKPGDSLGIAIELPTNRLMGMSVASYLESTDDPVTLRVAMGVLPDGTIYPLETILDAKAKDAVVTVANSGYQRQGQ